MDPQGTAGGCTLPSHSPQGPQEKYQWTNICTPREIYELDDRILAGHIRPSKSPISVFNVEDAGRVTQMDLKLLMEPSPGRFWKGDTNWINNCFVLDVSVRLV